MDDQPAPLLASAAPRSGALLVATPWLEDPNFERTVILLLEHGEDGTLGVVLNRPSPLTVAESVEDWADVVSEPAVVFVGGPVGTQGIVALGRSAGTMPEHGWADLPFGLGALDLNGSPADLEGELTALRLFAGHSGWGPGQLDVEIAEGAWWVLPALREDPFRPDAADLWHAVLARQKGAWRVFAHSPDDPSVN